jgi:hypothetical protein
MLGAGDHATQVASRAVRTIARDAGLERGTPGTIISKLETSNPNVAVWSEPNQDTTVIWLPDQQH